MGLVVLRCVYGGLFCAAGLDAYTSVGISQHLLFCKPGPWWVVEKVPFRRVQSQPGRPLLLSPERSDLHFPKYFVVVILSPHS